MAKVSSKEIRNGNQKKSRFSLLMAIGFTFSLLSLTVAQNTFATATDVTFVSFDWQKNAKFELQFYYYGSPISLKGLLYENNESLTPADPDQQSQFDIFVKAFPEGPVYAVVLPKDVDASEAYAFLMQRENGFYVGATQYAIAGRTSTLLKEMKDAFDILLSKRGWDASQSVMVLRDYFEKNPQHRINTFLDAVELGEIQSLPAPRINQDVVADGVVQMPDPVARPDKLNKDIFTQDTSTQPNPSADATGDQIQPNIQETNGQPTTTQPVTDPYDPNFIPIDMTSGWEGDDGE